MTKEEYIARMEQEDDWAPGWLAIEGCLEKLYPGQEPRHYGTELAKRAIWGGDQYLDGYSIYRSPNSYLHIVTFGMSEIYTNEESFGGEYSKWGYEMTMKLSASYDEDCLWVLDMLSNLARYTFTQKRFFEAYQYISGRGNPIKSGANTNLTSLIVVEDTELPAINTVHGKLEFLQLVGITQAELDAIMGNPENAKLLVSRMKEDNPHLVSNLSRTKNYL